MEFGAYLYGACVVREVSEMAARERSEAFERLEQ